MPRATGLPAARCIAHQSLAHPPLAAGPCTTTTRSQKRKRELNSFHSSEQPKSRSTPSSASVSSLRGGGLSSLCRR
ncbi:hypothetical protein LX36DRAFT_493405 [Colletotrichum falcatum]|nr:hypothetical protein LX36DRAFT_493405 [Colletotrichum falcatum]